MSADDKDAAVAECSRSVNTNASTGDVEAKR